MKNTLDVKELADAIQYLGRKWSSSDTIHTHIKKPLNKLVAKEISFFSKKELESLIENKFKDKKEYSLLNLSLSSKNPYIFSVLINKGAFHQALTQENQWLLKINPMPSLDCYNFMFNFEVDSKINKEDFIENAVMFLKNLDTNEKKFIAEKLYQKYPKKQKQEILDYCFQNINTSLAKFWLNLLKDDNININEKFPLNKYLPIQESSTKKDSIFFISSLNIPNITTLVENGFKFDEQNYTYNEKSLLEAVIASKRRDIITAIIPSLKFFSINEKESFLIKELKKNLLDQIINEPDNSLEKYYKALILETTLASKDSQTDKKKLKI